MIVNDIIRCKECAYGSNNSCSNDKQLCVRNSAFTPKLNTNKLNYWQNICEIQRQQTEKGIKKYGDVLENNPTNLSIIERLTYLEEELIDGLMYVEHIKLLLKNEELEGKKASTIIFDEFAAKED